MEPFSWDIICFEIPRHMGNLFELVHLSRVCKRLCETWKIHIKEIPNFKPTFFCYSRMIYFPITSFLHLEALDISLLEKNITQPINNEYVSQLKSLKWLKMGRYMDLLDTTILKLSGLTYLEVHGTSLSDISIRTLTKLTTLKLGNNHYISDDGISKLTSLTSLSLSDSFIHNTITDNGISNLTSLTYLNLGTNKLITSKGIEPLILLHEFIPGYNENCISDTIYNIVTNATVNCNSVISADPNAYITLSEPYDGKELHVSNRGKYQLKVFPNKGTRIDAHDIDAYTTIDVGRSASYMFGDGAWYTVGIW
jgi:hypothetical protein